MAGKYTEREMAEAIVALLNLAWANVAEHKVDEVIEKHPVLYEINHFGATGPTGSGLGNFGGHAVD